MCRKQNRGQRPSTSDATVETHPASIPITQATKSLGGEFKFSPTDLAEEPR